MLSCREVAARASMLIDGDLSFTERVAMRMHLVMCKRCRRFSRQLKVLIDTLALRGGQAADEPSAEFTDRVMQALLAKPAASWPRSGPNDEPA